MLYTLNVQIPESKWDKEKDMLQVTADSSFALSPCDAVTSKLLSQES